MSIEKLKEQARRHEQKEEWLKALDQYQKAIDRLAEDDQPDIGLYNRVGDLFVRVDNLDKAVEHYEQAVDLYMDAELPNNAIAVCKKVIRNVPNRYQIYLKMGQIRANQGFMPDARTNFLTYAERAAQGGDMEESLRALAEFADLAPDDTDLRMFVGEQMAAADHVDQAVEQLVRAYQALSLAGDMDKASSLEARILELDPDFDASAVPALSPHTPAGDSGDGEIFAHFGEIELGGASAAEAASATEEASEEAAAFGGGSDDEGPPHAGNEADGDVAMDGDFDIASTPEPQEAGEEDEGSFDLPLMHDGSDEDEDEDQGEDGDEDEAFDLPLMDVDDSDDAAAVGAEAPEEEGGDFDLALMDVDFDSEADPEDGDADLPLMDFAEEGSTDAGEPAPAPRDVFVFGDDDADDSDVDPDDLPLVEMDEDVLPLAAPSLAEAQEDVAGERHVAGQKDIPAQDDAEPSADELREQIARDPEDISLRQRFVEVAYMSGREADLVEAYLGLGRALDREGKSTPAKAAYRQVLQVDPAHEEARAALSDTGTPATPAREVAAHEDYVDLGAMILGDDEEKSTRFVVAYEEPSGDEEADFAKMLSQFKDKVSASLDADDVRAHHDLGTAYKEMGLLDEAVAEFQQALRASSTHLPTYEMLGQTFMEMGNPDHAVRSLERALQVPFEVEDELLGIYYYLARAYEEVDQPAKAVEFYDRVFSLDINFADVTERLRALR